MPSEFDPQGLIRREFARFLPDHRAVRAFEKLFSLIPTDLITIQEYIDSINTAVESAAADLIAGNIHTPDLIQFHRFSPKAPKPGSLYWEEGGDTLSLVYDSGLTQRIGSETFIRFVNRTGTTLNIGEVVYFDGLDFTVLQAKGARFIADGTIPSISIIGVVAETVAADEIGRATSFGRAAPMDTTGTPFGETWNVGDSIFASATVAGGLTRARPTAPNHVVPVGIVIFKDAAAGLLGCNIIVALDKDYGEFQVTSDTSPAAIDTAYPITLDTTIVSNGVALGTPASRMVIGKTGLYTIDVELQLSSGSASVKNVWVWFRVDGVDVVNSARKISLESNSALSTPSRSVTYSLASGSYVEIYWAADDTNVTLDAIAATAFAPAAPAVTVSVVQIQL